MPIEVDGGLIWSGGSGLGAMGSVYRQGCQPGHGLRHHEHAQQAREPGHSTDRRHVLLAKRLVAKAGRGKPPERLVLGLRGGLFVELVEEIVR